MRARIAFLVLFLPLALSAGHAPAAVLHATHRLEGNDGICSGTAIAPHALLTAHHCSFVKGDTIKVDDHPVLVEQVVTDGNDHDILIEHDVKFADYAQLASSVEIGDDFWIRGNPAGADQLVRRGTIAGTVKFKGPDGKEQSLLLLDYNGFFGDSGAGVFTEDGKLVAVVSIGDQINEMQGKDIDTLVSFKFGGCWQLMFTAAQLQTAYAA